MVINNNPLILAYRQVESTINSHVVDINATRLAASGQWIYPEYPEGKDSYYPRISVLLNTINFSEHGAGRFFDFTYVGGLATNITLGNWAVMNFNVVVFIKRDQKQYVTLLGESTAKNIQNKLQATYLQNQVAKALDQYKSEFTAINMDMEIGTLGEVYEDNEFLWACEVPVTITAPNLWGTEYAEGDLIADYVLEITATRE